jgi:hypothetical protein
MPQKPVTSNVGTHTELQEESTDNRVGDLQGKTKIVLAELASNLQI